MLLEKSHIHIQQSKKLLAQVFQNDILIGRSPALAENRQTMEGRVSVRIGKSLLNNT